MFGFGSHSPPPRRLRRLLRTTASHPPREEEDRGGERGPPAPPSSPPQIIPLLQVDAAAAATLQTTRSDRLSALGSRRRGRKEGRKRRNWGERSTLRKVARGRRHRAPWDLAYDFFLSICFKSNREGGWSTPAPRPHFLLVLSAMMESHRGSPGAG